MADSNNSKVEDPREQLLHAAEAGDGAAVAALLSSGAPVDSKHSSIKVRSSVIVSNKLVQLNASVRRKMQQPSIFVPVVDLLAA